MEKGVQFQILSQVRSVVRLVLSEPKIPISIHEKGFHDVLRPPVLLAMRALMASYVSRYFCAIATAYARPSAGLRTTLKVRNAGSVGLTVLTMLTVVSLNDASSSRNVTETQSMPNLTIRRIICLLKKSASFSVVDKKLSFMMRMLFGVAHWRIC